MGTQRHRSTSSHVCVSAAGQFIVNDSDEDYGPTQVLQANEVPLQTVSFIDQPLNVRAVRILADIVGDLLFAAIDEVAERLLLVNWEIQPTVTDVHPGE